MTKRERDDEHRWSDTDRLSRIERMLIEQKLMLMKLLRRSEIEIEMEVQQMADFNALNERVSKISDLATSFKTMLDELKAQRDAAVAELEQVKAADQTDQAAIDAAEAKLAEVTAALEAVTAVAANTSISA